MLTEDHWLFGVNEMPGEKEKKKKKQKETNPNIIRGYKYSFPMRAHEYSYWVTTRVLTFSLQLG